MNLQTIGALVGLVTGVLYVKDALEKPPVPRCPKCRIPLTAPGSSTSKCMQCGQLISWRVPR